MCPPMYRSVRVRPYYTTLGVCIEYTLEQGIYGVLREVTTTLSDIQKGLHDHI